MRKFLLGMLLGGALCSSALAHDILGMDIGGVQTARANEDVQIYFRIKMSAEHKACNINLQFGDGTESNIKLSTDLIGNDMVRIAHRYAQPGKYEIKSLGLASKKGLYSIPACVLPENAVMIEIVNSNPEGKKDSRNAGLENAERKDPRDRYEQALRAREKLFQRQ